jgi:vacuolar-type H+-ATPase subunit H
MGFMLSACSNVKKPAEEALKAAEQAVNGAKTEAAKIIPDQVNSLEAALSAAKDKFTKGDYKAALTEAQAIPGKAKEVLEAAKAKKEEFTKTWEDLSQGLPKMIGAIKSRVDILSKSKKLPANLTSEKFAEVKSKLSEAMNEWGVSQESFKGGNLADAVTKANTLKEKAVQMLQTLGMPVPQGAKS